MISSTPPEKTQIVVLKRMLKPRLYYFKKYIELDYGKRCYTKVTRKKDEDLDCPICHAWAFYDRLTEFINEKQ